jgi:phage FluMu protein Com
MENEYLIMKCPLCKTILSNPNKLREHRLKEHKSIYAEVKAEI